MSGSKALVQALYHPDSVYDFDFKVRMTDQASPDSVQRICDLLTGIASSLVDHPDQIRIETEEFESETVLRLYVAHDDLGKVIGKQGRTARSLRTILSAAGSKVQRRFSLDVQENDA